MTLFRKHPNPKSHNSIINYQQINIGTKEKPRNINLKTSCIGDERKALYKLFKKYRDVFAWAYDELKTNDTRISQHSIPLNPNLKPFQQKLGKMHPSLEPQVYKELQKLLVPKLLSKLGIHLG